MSSVGHDETTRRTPMLVAALYYARRGLAVFPLKPRAKLPLTQHGVKDASRDEDAIRAWWERWPDANVGVACGEPSGVLVVDVDGAEGETALADLEREHGVLPACWVSSTGRGRHLWFAHDERVRNSSKRLPKIDTRGTGGYVVAPPSVHPDGATYAWVDGRNPTTALPVAPEWLIERFVKQHAPPAPRDEAPRRERAPQLGDDHPLRRWCLRALDAELRELAREGVGGRNEALNKAAYKLGGYVHSGFLDEHEIVKALLEAAESNGLLADDGRAAVMSTIRSGIESGLRKPREMPRLEQLWARNPAPPRTVRRVDTLADPPDDGAPPPGDDDFGDGGDGGDPDELPEIFDTFDENEMAALADEYLARDDELYQRGGMLVHVLRDDAPGAGVTRGHSMPRIDPIDVAWLRALSTRRIRWMRYKRDRQGELQEVRIKPPIHAINAIAKRGWWKHVRRLEGVSITPVFRPDGTIAITPGYDSATGVLFEPYETFEGVPDAPSRQDVDDAIERLRYVVTDFPFERPEHQSAWLAAVLTPIARYAFRGPSPLFLVDANTPGTGKGLLATVTGLIAIGSRPTLMTSSRDEAEERKRITSIAMEGESMVNIDNVEGRFGSPAFCAALTSDEWSDRVLGGSKTYKGPLLTTWMLTANNVQLTTDMVRRTAHVRLVTTEERPEERTGFEIPDLEAYVRQHRPRLVAAALTILRGWHVAGRPREQLAAWGSFEGWSSVVRQALVWAGLPDPALTRSHLREAADTSTDQLLELVDALAGAQPPHQRWTAGEILAKAKGDSDSAHALREALESYAGGRGGLSSKSIGRLLLRCRGRVVDGRCIAGEKDPSRKQWTWFVTRADGTPAPRPTVESEPLF